MLHHCRHIDEERKKEQRRTLVRIKTMLNQSGGGGTVCICGRRRIPISPWYELCISFLPSRMHTSHPMHGVEEVNVPIVYDY
jgi:hypothetical protein